MSLSLSDVENALGAVGQLERAAPVMLGGLVLSGPEVPDELIIGGRQILVIHRLLGGGRVIDSVGNDAARLVLTGRFVGPAATRRARRVEAMREAAQILAFSVADLSARVWISEFSWSYQARGTICPYRLVLEREALPPTRFPSSVESAGSDIMSGLSTISTFLETMTEAGWVGSTMISTATGQITPVAHALGASGAVSRAQASLSKANALWQSGMSVSHIPSSVVAYGADLSLAESNLLDVEREAGSELERSRVENTADLIALSRHAGAVALSVETGSYTRRARNQMAI